MCSSTSRCARLSPAINDPTTASQVLDSVESLLRTLVGRDLDVGEVTGPRGRARVLLPLPGWDDYVSLSFDELIEMGAGHAQVRRRLERVLKDLSALAPASRRPPLQLRRDRLADLPSERARDEPSGMVTLALIAVIILAWSAFSRPLDRRGHHLGPGLHGRRLRRRSVTSSG